MSGVLTRSIGNLGSLLVRTKLLEAQVEAASDVLAEALAGDKKLLAYGNGRSAADASHLTTEFVCGFNRDRRPYPAISLAVHGGDLTAIRNDYDFNDIFCAVSGSLRYSGRCPRGFHNQRQQRESALCAAKKKQLRTIAFLGKNGGTCKGKADVELLVESPLTARIQEVYKFLLHTTCELTETRL